MVLKKFKDIYQSAESMTCSGCHNEYKPVTFKCHLERCPMLKQEEETSGSLLRIAKMNAQV
jgi:hypothetical protein